MGSIARCRARLIAAESSLWCLEQTPLFLRDSILNWSEMNRSRVRMSL